MALDHAILGFLNYQPFTGYDLKKMFDNSVRQFWPADQSQIYRTLNQLMQQGLVELEVVEQVNRPDRKVYHITPAGKEYLKQWLAGPVPYEELRSEPMIQIFFSAQLTDEQLLAKFKYAADVFRATLQAFDAVPQRIEEYNRYVQSPREMFCWNLTLESGKSYVQSQLEWAESVIRRIENKEIPQA
jgi:DNA-binding PadR family transcriptional regulator